MSKASGESTARNVGFKKSIYFILQNVFFERFCSGGIFAILALFLNIKLQFNSNASTTIFHANELILYFFSIIGAIIADSWLGLFKTLSLMTLLMSIGAGIVAVASIDDLQLPIKVVSLVGLLAVVVASGGMKSNQSVFGGNQFNLPDESEQLSKFFSVQYFVLKCGLLSGQIFVPILRHDVKCFGMDDCYPIAFGLPAAFMFVSLVLFICGKSSYVHVPPNENMFLQVCRCIWTALKQRLLVGKSDKKLHWLDYAEDTYGEKLVTETKIVLKVLTLFLTVPLFFALHGQTNSRWVFQASKMNGDIGWYTIKPDQMVMATSIFIIILIPLFEHFLYPTIAKIGIKTKFQKVSCGFFCAFLAYVVAAIVEWQMKSSTQISILWLLPQYLLIAMCETFVWVPILSDGFSKSPPSMKSVINACLYLTTAGGSLILVLVSSLVVFEEQMSEYFLYATLMLLNT